MKAEMKVTMPLFDYERMQKKIDEYNKLLSNINKLFEKSNEDKSIINYKQVSAYKLLKDIVFENTDSLSINFVEE